MLFQKYSNSNKKNLHQKECKMAFCSGPYPDTGMEPHILVKLDHDFELRAWTVCKLIILYGICSPSWVVLLVHLLMVSNSCLAPILMDSCNWSVAIGQSDNTHTSVKHLWGHLNNKH